MRLTMDATNGYRRALSPHALRWVRDELWRARGLAPHLEEAFTLSDWTAWTLADPSVPVDRLERFTEGGPIGAAETDPWREVAMAMTSDPAPAWVVPDPLARPDDAFLTKAEIEYQVVDDAVYYIDRSADTERIAAAWRQAASAAGQMGLVSAHEVPQSGLDASHLRLAGTKAVLVAVSAYDGDGIIFCQRSQ